MKMVSCAGCDQPIKERYLDKVLEQTWHTYCVRCYDCKGKLTGKCFSRDGKLFCKNDFFKRFGTKCAGCSQGILPEDYVRWARNKVYHVRCFTCMDCHKELSTGDELYILDDNRILCKRDYLTSRHHSQGIKLESPSDADLEESMISPSESDHLIGDSDCEDKLLGNGPGSIPGLNSLSSLSHYNNRPPSSGNGSGPLGLSCKSSPLSAASTVSDTGCNGPSSDNTLPVSSPGGGTIIGSSANGTQCGGPNSNNNNSSTNTNGSNNSNSNSDENTPGTKRRGPRTTIKAKQLDTLKQAFAETPKPTRHIREQLANQTGLAMRVIQVWFQNRRSKERRMKHMGMHNARRHFMRSPRRVMRSLRPGQPPDGIDDSGDIPPHFGYFSESSNPGEYGYGGPPSHHGPAFYDFFPNQQGPHNGDTSGPGLNQFTGMGNPSGPASNPGSQGPPGLHDTGSVIPRPSVLPFGVLGGAGGGPGPDNSSHPSHGPPSGNTELIGPGGSRSSPIMDSVLNIPSLTPDTYVRPTSTESNAPPPFTSLAAHNAISETPVW